MLLDAEKCRPLEGGPSFTLYNRLFRLMWIVCWSVLARWTPPPMHWWRRIVLNCFGARIGRGARVYASVNVWYPPHLIVAKNAVVGPGVICYCQGTITIGEKAVVSQRAHLCSGTHDISDPNFQLVMRPIVIGAQAWIAAEAFVGPGVIVGEGAVLGARAAAFDSLEPWTVYRGNPAQPIRTRALVSRIVPL
jgi:putative colanic acid biosynthesis acetyltransferase WcaF